MDVIKKYPELTAKVCEVLRRMHEEAKNKGKEKRARSIAKAIKKLRNEDGLSVSL
jgi:ABC-type nitrate/sulfonate/bicarbonate transport system substrate-binding protein